MAATAHPSRSGRTAARISFALGVAAISAALAFIAASAAAGAEPSPSPAPAPAPASSPAPLPAFAIASSAESFGDHPKLFPLLHQAGASMVRLFPEWPTLEPRKGVWDWTITDALVQDAAANHLKIFGVLAFLAPWASSGGDTRTFPMKDVNDFGDYAGGVIGHYKSDIAYWEVYNEFNGGFAKNGTVKDYAGLVRAAWDAGKKANPDCRIGIGCADVDLSFLEQVINAGAADHFDFVNVHPYSLMAAVTNGHEPVFLRLSTMLRAMLAKTRQRPDIELCVSEIGIQSLDKAEPEQKQAEAIVQANVLCMAQGIPKVFWFEGRGPSYGAAGDFGIIRHDWTPRPSYAALSTMTRLMGDHPATLGWYNPTNASYGFVFQGATAPVLVMWAATTDGDTLALPDPVTVTDLAGKATPLPAKTGLALTRTPVFITDLPPALLAQVKADSAKPFPWLHDYSTAANVTCTMGAANVCNGLTQNEGGDGKTLTGLVDGLYARRTLHLQGSDYMYFQVDGSYAAVGDRDLEITLTGQAVDPAKGCSLNLTYESATGYKGTDERWTLPAGAAAAWTTHTFTLHDANFASNWGWNFRLDLSGSPGDLWIKDVTVKRLSASPAGRAAH
jgi:hypothetical protein